jgi:DNA replication protein DnaC
MTQMSYKVIRFPVDDEKRLWNTFDFAAAGLDSYRERLLSTVIDGATIVLVGGWATGKTHLAIAIAQEAAQSGKMALYYSFDLNSSWESQRADLLAADLVILDDLFNSPKESLLLGLSQDAQRQVSDLLCGRMREKKANIVITTFPLDQWSKTKQMLLDRATFFQLGRQYPVPLRG